MGVLFDNSPAESEPVAEQPTPFQSGLRSGWAGLKGQVAAAAGLGAERLGFDDTARERYAQAQQLQSEAATEAANLPTWRDIGSADGLRGKFGTALDYALGTAGQVLPTIGAAGLGAGAAYLTRGAISPRLGGVAGVAVPEFGGMAQRQQADETSRAASPRERFNAAAAAAVPAAVLQTEVPGAIAERIAAPVTAGAGKLAARAAGDAAAFGGTSAAAEGVRQLGDQATNGGKPIDTGAIEEAGLEGLAAGVPLAGAGAGAAFAKKALTAPARAVGRVLDKIGKPAEDAGAAEEAKPTPQDPVEALREATKPDSSGASQTFWQDVAARADTAKSYADKGAEWIKANLPKIDEETQAKVRTAGEELLNKAGISPEVREQVAGAMGNVADKANQAVIASAKLAQDGADQLKAKAASAMEAFRRGPDVEDAAVKDTKKSEDFSGARKAIEEEISPLLGEPKADVLNSAAEAVRVALDTYEKGGKKAVTSDQVFRLIDMFGDKAVDVLDASYRALGKVEPEERARLYDALNEFRTLKGAHDRTLDLMASSLDKGLQDTVQMPQLRRELDALRDWVRHNAEAKNDPEAVFRGEQVRDILAERYGKNADKILDAVQKDYAKESKDNVLQHAREGADLNGEVAPEHMTEHEFAGTEFYGREQHGGDVTSLLPEHSADKEKNQITSALDRATKQNPDKSVSVVKAAELGEQHPVVQKSINVRAAELVKEGHAPEAAMTAARDEVLGKHGIVAVESAGNEPGHVNRQNIREVMVKDKPGAAKTSHYEPENGAFKVGEVHYDAPRLTEMMRRQWRDEYGHADKTPLHRTGRMFMEGVAALADHLGKPVKDIPDNLKIDKKGTTWGDVKSLDYTPEMKGEGGSERVTAVELEQRLKNLRDDYRRIKATWKEGPGKDATLERMEGYGHKLTGDIESAKEREHLGELFDPTGDMHGGIDTSKQRRPSHTDEGGTEVTSRKATREYLKDRGRSDEQERFTGATEKDPLGNIHKLGEDVEPLGTSHEGEPNKTMAKLNALRVRAVDAISKIDAAPAKAVLGRLVKLLDNAHVLSASAVRALVELAGQKDLKPSKIGQTVDAMHEKFKDKFDKSKNLPEPKPNAALKEGAAPGPKDREVKASLERAGPPTGRLSPDEVKAVHEHLSKVLGDSVLTEFKNILHAGEFSVEDGEHIIGISVHALDPVSTAYHESLHSFIQRLREMGHKDAVAALEYLSGNDHVVGQLRELLKNEPEALKQLKDPEEAAAYAYQFWAAGKLTIGPAAKGFFARVKEAIAKALGVWTKDQRAEEILRYFHSGEFKRDMGAPDAVGRALIEAGRNKAIDKVVSFTRPMVELGQALAVAGGERLRSSDVPALADLADRMKLRGTAQGKDSGYIPAARTTHMRFMNELAGQLNGVDPKHLDEAVQAMQRGEKAASPEARLTQRFVQDKFLPKLSWRATAPSSTSRRTCRACSTQKSVCSRSSKARTPRPSCARTCGRR
jgi:hypothetical protein